MGLSDIGNFFKKVVDKTRHFWNEHNGVIKKWGTNLAKIGTAYAIGGVKGAATTLGTVLAGEFFPEGTELARQLLNDIGTNRDKTVFSSNTDEIEQPSKKARVGVPKTYVQSSKTSQFERPYLGTGFITNYHEFPKFPEGERY